MSGTSHQQACAASAIIDDDTMLLDLMRSVILVLLHNQYVRSQLVEGLWASAKGSGMGLMHSSNMCDAALYTLAEIPLH